MYTSYLSGKKINSILSEIKTHGMENNVPNISEINACFLQHLISIKKPKKTLEIGTATGFSAIAMGAIIQAYGGDITSIEYSIPTFKIAQENVINSGLEGTINLIFGNALEVIPELHEGFDFIFIDGVMKETVDFLTLIWNKTNNEGIIIIDDVIKFKHKMTGLDDFLTANKIKSLVLPIDGDDGVMMIIKDSSIILE